MLCSLKFSFNTGSSQCTIAFCAFTFVNECNFSLLNFHIISNQDKVSRYLPISKKNKTEPFEAHILPFFKQCSC